MADKKKAPVVASDSGLLALRGFSGGLVKKISPEELNINQAQEAFDVDFTRRPGQVTTRRGRSKYLELAFEPDSDIHFQRMFTNVGMIIRSGDNLFDETIQVDFDLTDAPMDMTEHGEYLVMANGTDTLKYKQDMELTWHGCYTFTWEKDEIPAVATSFATVLPFYLTEDEEYSCCFGWERDGAYGYTGFVQKEIPFSGDYHMMFYQEIYYYNTSSFWYKFWTHCITNGVGVIGRFTDGSGSGAYRAKAHPVFEFSDLTIPQGSEIQEAKLTFLARSTQTTSFELPVTIKIVDSVSTEMPTNAGATTYSAATPFTEYTSLEFVATTKEWTPDSWTADVEADSADFAEVLQDVVAKSSWVDGNNTILIVIDPGDYNIVDYPTAVYRNFDGPVTLKVSWGDSKAGRTDIYTTSCDVGMEYADDSAVAQSDFATPVNLGVPVPGSAPTAAQGAAGDISGTYSYKVAFGNADGYIGNLSSASSDVTVSSKKVELTDIPKSSDPQVTERRIFRTKDGGTTYYQLDIISDNITTTYTDNEDDDTALGSEEETDHDEPPDLRRVHSHLSLIYGSEDDEPHVVYNSKAFDNWMAFPSTNYEPFGSKSDPIAGIRTLGEYLCAVNDHTIINLNTRESPEEKADSFSDRGAQGLHAIYHCGDALIIADPGGIFLFDTVRDVLVSEKLDPIFDVNSDLDDRVNNAAGDAMAVASLDDRIFISYTSMRNSATANNSTIVYNRTTKAFEGIMRTGFSSFAVDKNNKIVYGMGTDGYIYQLETGTDDDGSAISWNFSTKDISNEYTSVLVRKKGDKAKIDCDPNGGTITVEVYLDDTLRQTVTVTGNSRTTKRWRLPVDYNFYRLKFKVSGDRYQTVYGIEMMAEVLGF